MQNLESCPDSRCVGWFLSRCTSYYRPYNFFTAAHPRRDIMCAKILPLRRGELGGPNRVEYTTDYFWVVVCKNRRVHHKGNTGYEHKILLGESDAYAALPMLPETINVR